MNVPRVIYGLTMVFCALALGSGCQQPDQDVGEPATEMDMSDLIEDSMAIDTTAEAVWAFLENANYREGWTFWPGRSLFYEGTRPHGALLNTYLNDLALSGLAEMREDSTRHDLPSGAMLVKENYLPDSTLASITVLMKVENYDPDHHDWFWMKRLPDGTVEASGRVESCISCHTAASEDWDYLMTAADQWGS